MTTRIDIRIEASSAAEAREQMIGLLGASYKLDSGWHEPGCDHSATAHDGDGETAPPNEIYAEPPTHPAPPEAEAPKRERGKPAPGRARRTKEEIAEDEAADKAEAGIPVSEPTHANKAHVETHSANTQPVEARATLAISTGEERIDPTTAEDAAQDAADEAAEVEATKPAELTHDDVRAALKRYLDAYGTPAAMEDGPKVLTMMFGAEVTKVSAVPADQASLAKAVAGINEMLTKNPFSRRVEL